MSEPLPQLLMRRAHLENLPPLSLPERFELHGEDERSAASWERIISDSFQGKFSYSLMKNDPSYAPDRVYFIREHTQDIATAAAFLRPEHPGEGYVHMVGSHSWARGQGAGYWAVLSCLRRFRRDGLPSAVLTTDDFRLPAISQYLRLGFEPVMAHESHPARWQAVMEKLKSYQKPDSAPIPLWGAGRAPYIPESRGQAEPSLTPFPAPGSRGAVVVCPGGGYVNKAWYEGDPISRMVRACGVSAYTLDYRVLPAPLDAPLSDALRAVRLLRSMGYEKVAVLGFSAGGHLSCMAAVRGGAGRADDPDPVERFSARPDAFVPCYGAVELPDWAGETRADFDGPSCVTKDTPPAFIWHTFDDEMVPVTQAFHLMAALQASGVPFESHIYPHGHHGLGLAFGTSAEGWGELLQKWLLRLGFGPAE